MPDTLRVPVVNSTEFPRNLIKVAVCELRFPTLLELETEPPVAFQKALRKVYPIYDRRVTFTVGSTEQMALVTHVMTTADRNWTVSLRPFALALEVRTYTSFKEFSERLAELLAKTAGLLDADFFTRVGLRYVNALPASQDKIRGWVNPALVAPLVEGVYGTVDQFLHEVRGRCPSGRYSFRHGIAATESGPASEYTLDFDFYKESVPASEVPELVGHLNKEAFNLFSWAIGPQAMSYLKQAEG